jgi:hypothetical protein
MIQLFVEGQGETSASQKLIYKIIEYYSLGHHVFSNGRRIPNLHTDEGVKKAVNLAWLDPNTEGVLIMRDDEDNCPKVTAPRMAKLIKDLNAPFPVAYCIMYREFETLFIAYSKEFAGQAIQHVIRGTIQFKTEIPEVIPETIRGAKEWISKYLEGGRVYKPTTDQLSLTQALDIEKMISLNLPCFDTLTRCVKKIIENKNSHYVYPDVQ